MFTSGTGNPLRYYLNVSERCNRTPYYLEQTPVCLLETALSSEAVTAHRCFSWFIILSLSLHLL